MTDKQPGKANQPRDAWNLLCGLCMGCADVVPGVSGGTVALILGIYVRLVTAISHLDGAFLTHCRKGRWIAAADHVDLRFLVTLAAGIGSGIVGMTLVINRLLTDSQSRSFTLSVFFGMILASAFLIARTIETKTRRETLQAISLGFVAALLSLWISSLHHMSSGDPSLPWLFACGAIAICAMILPGISGAMILLVLGVYVHLTEVPKNLLSGVEVGHNLTVLVVFGCGCAISLVLFSKVLRWLLTRFHAGTMATLCGLMIGALGKLWPFQIDTTPLKEEFKHKVFKLEWPDSLDAHTVGILVTALLAMAVVFLIDRVARRAHSTH